MQLPQHVPLQGRREQRGARGQLKYYASLVLCSPKPGKENGTLFSGFSSDLQKKGLHRNWNDFSVQIQVISKTKKKVFTEIEPQ